MTRGLFIVFEGGEGAGKTTQARLLADYLKLSGVPVVTTREPGATPLGREIRRYLLHSGPDLAPVPKAEALLYAADRAQHVETVIRPALDAGQTVISDRYTDSTLAYQGAGRGIDVGFLCDYATDFLRPDLVFVLDLNPTIGLRRASRRGGPDRIEQEGYAFHAAVRAAFLRFAVLDPSRYVILRATDAQVAIAGQVRTHVRERMPAARL